MCGLREERAARTGRLIAAFLFALAAAFAASPARAAVSRCPQKPTVPGVSEKEEEQSPWLAMPILASDPKLGTSVGVLGAYVHTFDEGSLPSMFGLTGQYTTTDSAVFGLFAKTSFDNDNHRIVGASFFGRIKNDYDDFLGSGVPLKSEDELSAVVARYLYRVAGDWFIGPQAVYTDYQIVGSSALEEQFVEFLGLTGFRSGGLGAVAVHDSRDSDNSPTRGWIANLNNVAYREEFGGVDEFDVVRLDLRAYLGHGDGHVFAVHQSNQWTFDAPPGAFSPIVLRGYTRGEYLGENMASIEAEERLRIAPRWTSTLFAGLGALYGGGLSAGESDYLYPCVGGGLQFLLKEKEGIVANVEFALGKDDNYGVYIRIGYGF